MGGARFFVFWNEDPRHSKARRARPFAAVFSARSLGWSTLVQIVEAMTGSDQAEAEDAGATTDDDFGAPNVMPARSRRKEEVAFRGIAVHHPAQDTLVAVHRTTEDGAVHETFRTLRPRNGPKPLRAFSFLEVEGDDDAAGRIRRSDRHGRTGPQMNDFWISCGHHLLDRDEGGGLLVTDDFLKVYLARPELIPPPEACAVERTLHAALLADPRMAVSGRRHRGHRRCRRARELADADRLPRSSGAPQDAGSRLCRAGEAGACQKTPQLFVNQLVHVVLRNALDGVEDAQRGARAAELFFRTQRVTMHESSLIAPMRRPSAASIPRR